GAHTERALELEVQLLDLMSVVFLEVIYRAAACRTPDHLKWFNHYLRVLLDRVDIDTHVDHLADAHFQLLRVVAGAAGSVVFTVLLNSFRDYLQGPQGLELFPPESWVQLAKAFEAKDVGQARQVFQRCFDVRSARVLAQLSKARGGNEGGPLTAVVDL